MKKKVFTPSQLSLVAKAEKDFLFKRGDYCVLNSGSSLMRVVDSNEGTIYVQSSNGQHIALPSICVRPHSLSRVLGKYFDKIIWEEKE